MTRLIGRFAGRVGMPARPALLALGWFALACLLIVFLFRDAAARAVRLWIDTPTYSYAFLVVPIAIYLAAHKAGRAALPSVAPLPLLALLQLPIGLAWYAAVAAEIVEAQQFCLLGAVYVTFVALFGWRLARAHLVALLLLGFLVPSGQFLVPPLQVLSAEMAAGLLRLFGAPIYLDGLYIQMPEATYHVERGCAGLNFVLVTMVLALVVGELFYSRLWKKAAVMAGLLAVAVVSNPVRIFAIVYIDWLTNRSTDIVSDHLTYGWAFFAAILAVVLPVAIRFRDADTAGGAADAAPGRAPAAARLATAALLAVGLAAIAPGATFALGRTAARAAEAMPAMPPGLPGLELAQPATWRATRGFLVETSAAYAAAGQPAVAARVILRLTPTPRARLVDRWQPQAAAPAARLLDTAETGAGRVALYQAGGAASRMLFAVCYLAGRHCHPDPASHRRAVLAGLARDPLAGTGLVILSQAVPPARPSDPQRLLAAMELIVGQVAPVLAPAAK